MGEECADACPNVFARCRFLRHLGKLMVPLVVAFVALSYWAAAAELVGDARAAGTAAGAAARVFMLAVMSALVFMVLWSYFAAMLTEPGRVPRGWHPFRDEEQAYSEAQLLVERDGHGARDKRDVRRPRFCRRCRAWKPPRAHHCSGSGHCVLKLDHYCIWLLNSVGLLNYKAFLLFLLYTFVATLAAVCILLGPVVRMLRSGSPVRAQEGDTSPGSVGGGGPAKDDPLGGRGLALLVAFVVDAAFALSLAAFVVLHARLAGRNMTTIEQFEKAEVVPWPWDRGSFARNVADVFGADPARWWRPHLARDEAAAALRTALCA